MPSNLINYTVKLCSSIQVHFGIKTYFTGAKKHFFKKKSC